MVLTSTWFVLSRILHASGDIDFVIERIQDPGWIGKLLSLIESSPFVVDILIFISGITIILAAILGSKKESKLELPSEIDTPQSALEIRFAKTDFEREPIINEAGMNRGSTKSYRLNIHNSNTVDSIKIVSVEIHYKEKIFSLEWWKGKSNIEMPAGSTKPINLISFKNSFASAREILFGEVHGEYFDANNCEQEYNFTVVATGVGQPKVEKDFSFIFIIEGGSPEFKVYEAGQDQHILQEPTKSKDEIIVEKIPLEIRFNENNYIFKGPKRGDELNTGRFYFPRIKLYNFSDKTVEDVEVSLEKITFMGTDDEPGEAEGQLPCLLPFSQSKKVRTINAKQEQLVDVFTYEKCMRGHYFSMGEVEIIRLSSGHEYEIEIKVMSKHFDGSISERFQIGLKKNIINGTGHPPYDPYMKLLDHEATNKQQILQEPKKSKIKIIKKLNDFSLKGRALKHRLLNIDINDFPSAWPPDLKRDNMPIFNEIASWEQNIYYFLRDNVPASAEWFVANKLKDSIILEQIEDITMDIQQKWQTLKTRLVEISLERILEIISRVDSSSS